MDLEADLVALGYRFRWSVELFFRWIKCLLGCRHWLAESPRGAAIQLYLALIAALLLQLYTGRKPNKRMLELLQWHQLGMASETGVLDIDPANVLEKGRLQPGKMFLVDTAQKRIIADEEIKQEPRRVRFPEQARGGPDAPEPPEGHEPEQVGRDRQPHRPEGHRVPAPIVPAGRFPHATVIVLNDVMQILRIYSTPTSPQQ